MSYLISLNPLLLKVQHMLGLFLSTLCICVCVCFLNTGTSWMGEQLGGRQLNGKPIDIRGRQIWRPLRFKKVREKNPRIKVGGGGWVESGMRQREGPASPVSGREGERSHHLNPLKFTTCPIRCWPFWPKSSVRLLLGHGVQFQRCNRGHVGF